MFQKLSVSLATQKTNDVSYIYITLVLYGVFYTFVKNMIF